MIKSLAKRKDFADAVAAVLRVQLRALEDFTAFDRELARIRARVKTNRDVAGWCENCPRFLG